MEMIMKTFLTALAASAVLAVAAVPASAETDLTEVVGEVVKLADPSLAKLVKEPSSVTKEIERQLDKLDVGSSDWWSQYDRERGGRGARR
jgi:hypothetical protein